MNRRNLVSQISEQLTHLEPGAVFTAKDFLSLGNRAAVDQVLSRLARRGAIRRVARGLYDRPRQDPVFGDRSPAVEAVARALARGTGSEIQVSGALAANQLGWSDQVPAQVTYLTNGPRRAVRIGRRVVTLRPASPKYLLAPGTKAGSVVQAFRFLGREGARAFVPAARAALSERERALLAREASHAVDWLRPLLEEVASASWT